METLDKWTVVSKSDGFVYGSYPTRKEAREEAAKVRGLRVVKTEDAEFEFEELEDSDDQHHCGDDCYDDEKTTFFKLEDGQILCVYGDNYEFATDIDVNHDEDEPHIIQFADAPTSMEEIYAALEELYKTNEKEKTNMKKRAVKLFKATQIAKATYLAA